VVKFSPELADTMKRDSEFTLLNDFFEVGVEKKVIGYLKIPEDQTKACSDAGRMRHPDPGPK
jgi:hypothetical protein